MGMANDTEIERAARIVAVLVDAPAAKQRERDRSPLLVTERLQAHMDGVFSGLAPRPADWKRDGR